MAPNLGFYTLFILVPAVAGLALGLFNWDDFGTPHFVGLGNFRIFLNDPNAIESTYVTLEYLLLGILPTLIVGFMLAVLLDAELPGIRIIRTVYLVPITVSTAVASVMWSQLYQPKAGLINRMLGLIGISGPPWLNSPGWALPALTVVMSWIVMPVVILLYLAGLKRISRELYEAASIDGAGVWTRLWRIIWPNVSRSTLLISAFLLIYFGSNSFEVGLIMTNGGPLGRTEGLAQYAYQVAFQQGEYGYGAMLTAIQFAIFMGLILIAWLAFISIRAVRRRA